MADASNALQHMQLRQEGILSDVINIENLLHGIDCILDEHPVDEGYDLFSDAALDWSRAGDGGGEGGDGKGG
eukprot:9756364-Lingulodinium_polyedra.AAC.1